MLTSHSVSQTCGSSFDFWYLPITKSFRQPMYFLGQQVFHRIRQTQGEVLHPVTVIGISWTGIDWEYGIEFPKDHPQFKPRDIESDWVDEWQLESI